MSAPPPIPPRPDGQPGFPGAPPPIPPRLPLPQPPPPPGKVLADGTKAGADVLVRGVKWQASGWLQEGCLPEPWGQQPVMLKRCWTLLLGGPGENTASNGRQRTEFMSWPPAPAGTRHVYKWRYHLVPGVASSSKFFHITQVLSREQGGFVMALGLVNNRIQISSILPHEGPLPSIPVEAYWGRTTFHRCVVVWGDNGSIEYAIQDAVTGEPLLAYNVTNVHVPAQGSIKQGLYREHVSGPAAACIGDLDFFKQ